MRIAVVGATGRIGAKLTKTLLGQDHRVKALSRGGAALDRLVQEGAEPFIGSFDTGEGDLKAFFGDVDAAFLMVKTDWNNIDGHYSAVARRFVEALDGSPVLLAVNLSAMGAEVDGKTGHFEVFHQLEQQLNALANIDLVHLRAAWFMENTLAWTDSVARYGRLSWFYEPDLKMPWVATDDIAALAARELATPTGQFRVVRETGSHDLTMREVATIIGREIRKPVEYRFIDRANPDLKKVFLERFGTPAQWTDDDRTAEAMNQGVVRFHGGGEARPPLPTAMETFIKTEWTPAYLDALDGEITPETFLTWNAR